MLPAASWEKRHTEQNTVDRVPSIGSDWRADAAQRHDSVRGDRADQVFPLEALLHCGIQEHRRSPARQGGSAGPALQRSQDSDPLLHQRAHGLQGQPAVHSWAQSAAPRYVLRRASLRAHGAVRAWPPDGPRRVPQSSSARRHAGEVLPAAGARAPPLWESGVLQRPRWPSSSWLPRGRQWRQPHGPGLQKVVPLGHPLCCAGHAAAGEAPAGDVGGARCEGREEAEDRGVGWRSFSACKQDGRRRRRRRSPRPPPGLRRPRAAQQPGPRAETRRCRLPSCPQPRRPGAHLARRHRQRWNPRLLRAVCAAGEGHRISIVSHPSLETSLLLIPVPVDFCCCCCVFLGQPRGRQLFGENRAGHAREALFRGGGLRDRLLPAGQRGGLQFLHGVLAVPGPEQPGRSRQARRRHDHVSGSSLGVPDRGSERVRPQAPLRGRPQDAAAGEPCPAAGGAPLGASVCRPAAALRGAEPAEGVQQGLAGGAAADDAVAARRPRRQARPFAAGGRLLDARSHRHSGLIDTHRCAGFFHCCTGSIELLWEGNGGGPDLEPGAASFSRREPWIRADPPSFPHAGATSVWEPDGSSFLAAAAAAALFIPRHGRHHDGSVWACPSRVAGSRRRRHGRRAAGCWARRPAVGRLCGLVSKWAVWGRPGEPAEPAWDGGPASEARRSCPCSEWERAPAAPDGCRSSDRERECGLPFSGAAAAEYAELRSGPVGDGGW